MEIINKFLYLLSNQERKRAYLLLVMILLMALIDMLGIASIMPFIAVITNPDLIENNYILNYFYEFSGIFGVTTNQQFYIYIWNSCVFIFTFFFKL